MAISSGGMGPKSSGYKKPKKGTKTVSAMKPRKKKK